MAEDPKEQKGLLSARMYGLNPPDNQQLKRHHFAGLLAQAAYAYNNRWFREQDVFLDGFEFVNCRFDSCRLFTAKGTFKIVGCALSDCKLYFDEDALRVVRLYNVNTPETWAKWPDLAPTFVDQTGRISIP